MKTKTRYPKLQPDREKKKVMVNNDISHELQKRTVDIYDEQLPMTWNLRTATTLMTNKQHATTTNCKTVNDNHKAQREEEIR